MKQTPKTATGQRLAERRQACGIHKHKPTTYSEFKKAQEKKRVAALARSSDAATRDPFREDFE